MTRGLLLAALLAACPASAQEAAGPRRSAGNAPVVSPIVMPSLPVTPAAGNASILTELIRRAAATALGIGSQGMSPVGPAALNFAPGRDGMAPPVLPNSAMEASQGLAPKASTPGLAPKKVSASSALTASGSQSSSAQQNRQTQSGRLPDVLPITIEATQNMPAISRSGDSIGEKTQALKVPFEAASGLATAGQGRGDAERARGLGDGIWDVMTNQDPSTRGGLTDKDNLRDSLNAGAGAPGMGGAGAAGAGSGAGRGAPDFEALLDYSALASGGPGSKLGGSAAGTASSFGVGADADQGSALSGEFLNEALDAAETARRYAREELAAEAKGRERAFSGPVAKLWLDTLDSVVRILTLGGNGSKLKPTWSAEAGDSRPASRYAGLAAKAPAEALDVPLLAAAPGAAGLSGSTRLVTRLASKSGVDQTPAPAKGFIDPAAKSVPDALLVLSLLPLLAVALGYLREFRN